LENGQEEIKALVEERRNERKGRIRAEKQLREAYIRSGGELRDEPTALQPSLIEHFPLRPIGTLRSCFSRRNGTPRQPLLVTAARSMFILRPELPAECLHGLSQYSHCWILYIFHQNTDLQRLWQGSYDGIRSKIRVPRLNGGRMGVLATRSPHRPCPIGLSIAQILAIDGSKLLLGGADVVDGSPVLDIKPYIPFADSVDGASTPRWVGNGAQDAQADHEEQLIVGSVMIPEGVETALRDSFMRRCEKKQDSELLYKPAEYAEFRNLVTQVLSRDIRSVAQRIKVPNRVSVGNAMPPVDVDFEPKDSFTSGGRWHVMLEGIEITYDFDEESNVILRTADYR
jgi:tRNA-Thr(GGU) m(6)t(6)A37 methyltransferase TsaA